MKIRYMDNTNEFGITEEDVDYIEFHSYTNDGEDIPMVMCKRSEENNINYYTKAVMFEIKQSDILTIMAIVD